MAAVSVAAEWQLLFNRYYRKFEVYQMQWKHVDLTRNKVACAPFGGPIAVIRDDGKIVQLYAESALRKLRIFNSAGVQIAETVWKNPGGRLIGMAWSEDLTLHCITQDGTIYCYSVHAELLKTLTIGEDRLKYSIAECVFWGNGVVCMNEAFQLFCISDFRNPEPVKLADTGLEDPPRCMAVIEPQYTMSGNVEVLLAVEDYVMVVEEDGTQQIGAEFGPYQKIVVSGNGKYVACFTVDGTLLVLPSDFSDIAFQYQCESVLPPDQLAWCGMDSVLLYWDDMLLMVGPSDGDLDPVRYFYDDPILIIPECDGVRVLSNHGMEFLQRVPDSTVSIFQIGSTMPAALLFDALDHFDRRSAKADENLRLIRSSLPEAVEACIDAASHEFNVSLQRTLLRAASYGQAFCSQFQRNYIRDTSRMLRVLNAIRNIDVGMPLSIQQYKLLTPSVLIGRLINAHLHLQALEISRYLEMNQEVVIMNWACAKISVSTSIPDPDLLEILLYKLRLCKGISYAAVASHADNSGRRKLAAMLVEHEPRSSKQVPLLLSIGEEVTALTKATESGDTDLVYLVLFHVRQKGPAMEFHRTIQARSLARDLFVSYARVYKRDFLKNFLASTGDVQDVAFLFLKESWEMAKNPVASRGSPINGPRIKLIENAHKLFSETKEHVFESKEAEEHAKLLRIQQELEITTKQPIFVDSSVIDTIRTCIVLGNHRAALKVKTEFKVSDKQWYWLKAFALATIRDWDALEKFSKEKRPPSYRPFVEACIEADEKVEAAKYIPKLSDPEDRAKAYVRIGMTKEADDVALQSKDNELLGRLKSTFSQNAGASSIFDTFRLSFQGIS